MKTHIRNVALVLSLTATAVAAAADPGTKWRVTTSMSGLGMNMPARVTEMCVTGSKQDQPPPTGQSDCSYTELSRSGSTVRYAVQCSTMKGPGEISYDADHYRGKFDMHSVQGAMSATYEGQRLGTCDGTKVAGGTQSKATASQGGSTPDANNSALTSASSELGSGLASGAGEIKDAASEVAADAAQSVKDDAKESVKDKAEDALKGWFGR